MDKALPTGQWRKGVFEWPVRVYIEDVDAGGIVYHANHLKYAERARTELLAAGGLPHARLMQQGGMIVVGRLAIDYLKPLRLEEELLVKTRLLELGNDSARLEQVIEKAGEVAARLEVGLVYLGSSGRPARWPEAVKAALGHRQPGGPG